MCVTFADARWNPASVRLVVVCAADDDLSNRWPARTNSDLCASRALHCDRGAEMPRNRRAGSGSFDVRNVEERVAFTIITFSCTLQGSFTAIIVDLIFSAHYSVPICILYLKLTDSR